MRCLQGCGMPSRGGCRQQCSGELPAAVRKHCQMSAASKALCCIACCTEGTCVELLVVGTSFRQQYAPSLSCSMVSCVLWP